VLLWVLTTFAFFNVSGSKMAPYILPIFPALALLGGRHVADLSRRAWLIHLALLAVRWRSPAWCWPPGQWTWWARSTRRRCCKA
jgi:4-amino-4-deoxy-L-arabinose transferase-like glycosyltransferase